MALQLGLAQVPTLRLAGLSAARRKVFALAENRLAEQAGWDRDIPPAPSTQPSPSSEADGIKPGRLRRRAVKARGKQRTDSTHVLAAVQL